MKFILASASPRRREILAHLGLDFAVRVADADERSDETDAERLVEQLAAKKARAVYDAMASDGTLSPDTVILAADTVVASPAGAILGKPHDARDAKRMLRELSGNTHRVVSGIAVLASDGRDGRDIRMATAHEVTEVTFATLTDDIIARYVASGEPMDKAGAYGIQDTAALWIEGIRGDYFNVVGLPVHRLEQTLNEQFGLSIWH